MKKMSLLFSISVALFYQAASAAPFPRTATVTPTRTIQSEPSTPQIPPAISEIISYQLSGTTFEQVKIANSSTLNYENKKTELKSVSYGIRKKKVFGLIPLKIYVIEFLSANPNLINKDEEHILSSLKKSQAVQLKLTMSRDLAGKKITESFKDALEANAVNTEKLSKELEVFMSALSGVKEFKTGDAFSMTAYWSDPKNNTATLIMEKPDLSTQVITGDESFVTDLFSIWFGKPADDKLAELKKVLLK